MYLVSDSDIDRIKRYIGEWAAQTAAQKPTSLRVINDIRMARILIDKLEAKQPFPKEVLPKDLRRFLK